MCRPNTLEKLEIMTILYATDLGSLAITHDKRKITCLEFAKAIVSLLLCVLWILRHLWLIYHHIWELAWIFFNLSQYPQLDPLTPILYCCLYKCPREWANIFFFCFCYVDISSIFKDEAVSCFMIHCCAGILQPKSIYAGVGFCTCWRMGLTQWLRNHWSYNEGTCQTLSRWNFRRSEQSESFEIPCC